MLVAATIVFLGALVMIGLGILRRGVEGLPLIGKREDINQGLVLLFGIGVPVVTLIALFGAADVYLVRQTGPPAPSSTSMTVDVIGHQWWWEVRYPGTTAVTANEIHVPVDTRVNVVATSADVIHSFWVPQLARKIDMIPGRQNRVLLYASRAGSYRGQCAEFCGFQHANMALYVVAQPTASFRTWLANMALPVPRPTATTAKAGQRLFLTSQCASCHQLRGTSAQGTVGPDLTHLATRSTLAGGTIPNDPAHLQAWVSGPQAIKPGNRMPDLGLAPAEVAEIVSYLDSLH
jgi:cytochrome c oxidase subunit 2